MGKTILTDGDEGVLLIVKDTKTPSADRSGGRTPVHVVYGGAHLFRADTPAKLGKRSIESLNEYAPNFVEFAQAVTLPGTGSLPRMSNAVRKLEAQIAKSPDAVRERDFAAWFAWTVYTRTLEKLRSEP